MNGFKSLSERQRQILGLMVRGYIETGTPIGSKTLVKRYGLAVSSATVRNELSTLDDLGFLTQMHTSAGRIPTELGYRYFVQRLLGEFELPTEEQQTISHQFHQTRLEIDQWMKLAAAILARTSGSASLVTSPRPPHHRFKHVQLIVTQGRLVLMVVVLNRGIVRQQMLALSEPLPQSRLSAAAERLNLSFSRSDATFIRSQLGRLDTLEAEVAQLVVEILERLDYSRMGTIYRDGIVNLLEHEGIRQAVKVLEERSLLGEVISEVLEPEESGVKVVIGGEGRWEELKDCTIILSRYGVAEDMVGEIGVLGPTRMSYGHNISAVRYVADLMSGLVNDYFSAENDTREVE